VEHRGSRTLVGVCTITAPFDAGPFGTVSTLTVTVDKLRLLLLPVFGSSSFYRTADTQISLVLPRYQGIPANAIDYTDARRQTRGGIRIASADRIATFWALDRPKVIRVLEEFGWSVENASGSFWLR